MFKRILIKNGEIFYKNQIVKKDILLCNGKIKKISDSINDNFCKVINAENLTVIPGLIDVHVHLREPGFTYKEDLISGTLAAAAGGFTTVCCMPNTNPPIDNVHRLLKLKWNIFYKAKISVLPYSAITIGRIGKGKLVDFQKNSKYCFAFSDDGTGIQEKELMEQAMIKAKICDKHIVAHCEDIKLANGGCVHLSEFSKTKKLPEINSESEFEQIKRDIELAKKTSAKYHVCHISTAEGVNAVRHSKNKNITCEVTPHHLLLNANQLVDRGEWKMNPPLRSTADQDALIKGIKDGSISIIATDHAPHSDAEKSKGLKNSAFGIPGLETAFPLMYTYLVEKNIISFNKLIELMSFNPSRIFNIKNNEIEIGKKIDLTIVDLKNQQKIDQTKFLSKSKLSPFNGWTCKGWPVYTVYRGNIIYKK